MSSYQLRTYQREAVDLSMQWLLKNTFPALIELSGGAGKSLIFAELAKILYQKTSKRVLGLVPTEDLLLQNGEKMEMTGMPFSYYSASVSKSLRHPIVIATDGTFKSIAKEKGHEFCAVIVDEAHRVTPTFKEIINDMKEGNPNLRVIGMTGTPFRMKTGYIYELDEKGVMLDKSEAHEPYYKKLLMRLTCNDLIAMNYLTPVSIGETGVTYDTDKLKIGSSGLFTDKSVKTTFEGKGSITEQIVKDAINRTKDRKGVMFFCATIEHCEEVIKYLPEDSYVFLHSKMKKKDRRQAIADFKSQKKKYLVNKDIATVGFDAPHADACVLMRALESNGLFQQIVWRVVRLYEGKTDALLLDYGKNIEKLFDGSDDIFTPKIKVYGNKEGEKITVQCPTCEAEQEFSKRMGYELFDANGYAVDEFGTRQLTELGQHIPAHHGRRCKGVVAKGKNQFERCDYKWSFSLCKECGHENDIAARECASCGIKLITPDSKLTNTPTVIKKGEKYIATVTGWNIKEHSNFTLAVFKTPHGEISEKFYPNHPNRFIAQHGVVFERATQCGEKMPRQIEYTLTPKGTFHITRYIA